MNNNDNVWNYDNVPQEFWQRIEESEGVNKKLIDSLQAFSSAELKEIFAQNDGLSEFLVVEIFPKLPQILKEESSQTLREIADLVITQGRSRYEEILEQPEQFPSRDEVDRPIFPAQLSMCIPKSLVSGEVGNECHIGVVVAETRSDSLPDKWP